MKWRPTPPDERIAGRRLVENGWQVCTFDEFKPGDIVQFVSPDGETIHPITQEADHDTVSVIRDDAFKNDPLGSTGQHYGMGVEIDVYASLADLRAKALS